MTALSLILPCFNEAERLPATLATYLAQLPTAPGTAEVLVVDDGSTDATAVIAQAAAARDARVRVLGSRPNHGKGFAVRTGMLAAAGERLVFTDADGAYGPGELERVVMALAAAPVAIGTRGPASGAPLARQVASRAFNQALHLLSDLPFTDTQCGLKSLPPPRRPPAVRPGPGQRVRLRRRAAPAGQAAGVARGRGPGARPGLLGQPGAGPGRRPPHARRGLVGPPGAGPRPSFRRTSLCVEGGSGRSSPWPRS
jgi:Glycosyl transferase family 2